MTQRYKKKLIEVAIPLDAINTASAYEKLPGIGPHPRGIHLWWARRPHAATRAILFCQLVDDPSSNPDVFATPEDQDQERQRLFRIIEELAQWKNSNNEEVLNRARVEIAKSCDGDIPPIYDPFAGGGSIPMEALRLGMPSYASDLNPVASMIVKAMIEVFPQFAGKLPVHPNHRERVIYSGLQGLAEDFRYYGDYWCDKVRRKVGHLYPEAEIPRKLGGGKGKVVAWLWARTVPSPDPALGGLPVPLIRSFDLSNVKGRKSWLEPVVEGASYRFEVRSEQFGDRGEAEKGTVGRQGGRCLVSGAAMPLSYIREQARAGNLNQTLVSVAVERSGGKIYLPANDELSKIDTPPIEELMPSGTIDHWPGCTNCVVYGMSDFSHLFSIRQSTALLAFSETIPEVLDQVEVDMANATSNADDSSVQISDAPEYRKAIAILLSFALDRALDFNNVLTGWRPGNEKIMYLFSRHAIPMVWDYGEANILEDVVGGMPGILKYQSKCVETLPSNGIGNVRQMDARLVHYPAGAVISTDPPYYDNVPYSNLSDFFYIWMKKNLKNYYPEIFSTMLVPKQDEIVANQFRFGSQERAEEQFLGGMREAITNFRKQSSDRFPITIYYAFKQSEIANEGLSSTGWATFLSAIIDSGLTVEGTWPVRTESSSRLRAIGSNALANSVVLVCRKKEANAEAISRAEFIRALKRELPAAIAELQAANIAPADMPQSAIGPGMGIFSRCKAVLESDDSPMSVKTALQLINAELDEYLGGIQGEFDPDTRFAISWFEQNGMGKGDFGLADSLARARGIAVESVKHAGIVESQAGKVRILKRDELDPEWEPQTDTHLTVWECLQYLVRAHEKDGISYNTALLLRKIDDKAEAVKDLAYCLYDICANKRQDAREATAYNALIADWSDLTREAAAIVDIRGTGQTRMDF
jgi:putative DNA methylase